MDESAREHRKKTFLCQLCGLSCPYTSYGQKPPNTRAIVLLEECYVTKDPFSPDKEKFLVLGSKCSSCGVTVCVGSVRILLSSTEMLVLLHPLNGTCLHHCKDCSLFYTKRFCLRCVNKNLQQFPRQIRTELAKKLPP